MLSAPGSPPSAGHRRAMARWQPVTLLTGACALGLLGACDVTIKDGDVSFGHLHGRATREWKRQYPLESGGRVEIINGNGPVEIMAGADGIVDVAAVLSARSMTNDRARTLLERSKVDERILPGHIRLATVRGNESGGLEVTYKVSVPADARVEMTGNNGTLKADGLRGHVRAMAANGSVELTRLRGSVDVATVNGTISAQMAEVTARVRLEVTNGRVMLEVPKDTKATLNARSVNGGIAVTGLGIQEASGRRIRSLESVLNGGGPEVDVRATNGRIAIEGK
jgi:Putative adhesin